MGGLAAGSVGAVRWPSAPAAAASLVVRLGLVAVAGAGCGGPRGVALRPESGVARGSTLIPVTAGRGARYRPPAGAHDAARAAPCAALGPGVYGVHLELFAAGRVVVVPAGIGVRPPLLRDGAEVRGGRCVLRLRTLEPTGLIAVGAGAGTPTLGTLFAVWGQPLSPARMAGFVGRVRAWLGGGRWHGDPAAIPLRRHAQVVVEVGIPPIPPHSRSGFPPGY